MTKWARLQRKAKNGQVILMAPFIAPYPDLGEQHCSRPEEKNDLFIRLIGRNNREILGLFWRPI